MTWVPAIAREQQELDAVAIAAVTAVGAVAVVPQRSCSAQVDDDKGPWKTGLPSNRGA